MTAYPQLYYINKKDSFSEYSEVTAYCPMLVLSKKLYLTSDLSAFIQMNIGEDDSEISTRFCRLFLSSMATLMNNMPENTGTKMDVEGIMKVITGYRAKKIHAKNELILYRQALKMVQHCRGMIHEFSKEMLQKYNGSNLVLFAQKKEILINEIDEKFIRETEEDKNINLFKEILLSDKYLLTASEEILDYFNEVNEEEESEKEEEDKPFILTKKLIDFPVMNTLSYEELKYTRETLLPFSEELMTLVNDLKHAMMFDSSKKKIDITKVKSITDLIKESGKKMQIQINESLYLQQFKNTEHHDDNISIYFAIATIQDVLNAYSSLSILEDYTVSVILERLEKQHSKEDKMLFLIIKNNGKIALPAYAEEQIQLEIQKNKDRDAAN